MSQFHKLFIYFFLFSSFAIFIIGCKSTTDSGNEESEEAANEEAVAEAASKIVKIDKVLFSVPSPLQISTLIKKSGANYNNSMLNSPKNVSNYSTTFSKALNLGIYGADLGYTTIYDQTQDAISYLNVIKNLASELGITGSFEKSTIQRFQNNLGKKDSILTIISEAFRSSDAYLKNNQRKDVSALIIAGGWIEALYYATIVAQNSSNKELLNRIGEQKITLDNLIRFLMEFQDQEEIGNLIDQLLDLSNICEGIEFIYTYQPPTVDAEKKFSIINSKSEVKISSEQLAQITKKIQLIRNQIVK